MYAPRYFLVLHIPLEGTLKLELKKVIDPSKREYGTISSEETSKGRKLSAFPPL